MYRRLKSKPNHHCVKKLWVRNEKQHSVIFILPFSFTVSLHCYQQTQGQLKFNTRTIINIQRQIHCHPTTPYHKENLVVKYWNIGISTNKATSLRQRITNVVAANEKHCQLLLLFELVSLRNKALHLHSLIVERFISMNSTWPLGRGH